MAALLCLEISTFQGFLCRAGVHRASAEEGPRGFGVVDRPLVSGSQVQQIQCGYDHCISSTLKLY